MADFSPPVKFTRIQFTLSEHETEEFAVWARRYVVEPTSIPTAVAKFIEMMSMIDAEGL